MKKLLKVTPPPPPPPEKYSYPHLIRVLAFALLFVFVFALAGCTDSTEPPEEPPAPEMVRITYLPISDEESFSGYHWIRYATDYEDERFGIFTNTQTANVTKQTYRQGEGGTFVVDYSQKDTYVPTMGNLPPRVIYKQANIYYEGFYNTDFCGYRFDYDDTSSFAPAYVAWRVVFVGTDWEFYQPIFHVYRIYYTYIERNPDETITFYRCNFSYRLHYNKDWLAELAENPEEIPTYD